MAKKGKSPVVDVLLHKINNFSTYHQFSSCTSVQNRMNSKVTFYQLSPNPSYHYEYRYELNEHGLSSNESRLILLLTGKNRKCVDWWDFLEGGIILSQMRSFGFSILAICTPRDAYEISMPIQKNLDVHWIFITLQAWMKNIYFTHFQHYPRLYLFGISRGSQMSSLLCRVLPVQAQILYITPGYQSSLLIRSDHDKAMQHRLTTDHALANWFYFDYCSKANFTTNKNCPFDHAHRNYFTPVPPTYFVHHKNDPNFSLSQYYDIVSALQKDAINLGGSLLAHKDAIKLYIAYPLNITVVNIKEIFDRWICKPWFAQLFYEHFINSTYKAHHRAFRTCWCNPTNFLYFTRYPNMTKTWSITKQNNYRDYVNYITRSKTSFCETVCGKIMTVHAMASHNIENTLTWIKDMDHQRSLYRSHDFSNDLFIYGG